jgi:ribose transport system substrate-binding protein
MYTSTGRATTLVALTAAVALLAGCGSTPSTDGQGTATGGDVPDWCGTDSQITFALLDGFGGNAWRQIVEQEARDEAAKCPSVTSFEYTDAQGDTQKAISDINAMAATGVNAMVVFPDAGEAVLPAIRKAHDAGVTVVPYRNSPGGEPGVDYDVFVSSDLVGAGEKWGNWIKEQFPDGATMINIGGPAGNTEGIGRLEGLQNVLAEDKYTWVGEQPWEVTDWDPAKTQQVITAAVAKYPEIDVIVGEYGGSFVGGLDAFTKAGRSIPAITTQDGNALGCYWTENQEANPNFKLFTVTSGTSNVRLAVQHAVAIATGGVEPDNTVFPVDVFENSASDDQPVQCDESLPLDVVLSSSLPKEELQELFGQ